MQPSIASEEWQWQGSEPGNHIVRGHSRTAARTRLRPPSRQTHRHPGGAQAPSSSRTSSSDATTPPSSKDRERGRPERDIPPCPITDPGRHTPPPLRPQHDRLDAPPLASLDKDLATAFTWRSNLRSSCWTSADWRASGCISPR